MALSKQFEEWWKQKIQPRFKQQILETEVALANGRKTRYVNLDNAATTKPFKRVQEEIEKASINYGSVHRGAGQHSKTTTHSYEAAREIIKSFVQASPEDYVIFTQNTTGAINQAAALFSDIPGNVLVSDIEHSSNLLPWQKYNHVVTYKTEPGGTLSLRAIEKAFKAHNNIKLLAITGASNVTGYRPPIHEIAEFAHRNKAQLLVDACQLVQHTRLNMLPHDDPCHIDFIAFSGHKMYAPYGIGCLIGPKQFFDAREPYQSGGGNLPYITAQGKMIHLPRVQTHDPGTPNALGAIALATACQELSELNMEEVQHYEQALIAHACEKLQETKKVRLYTVQHNSIIPCDILSLPSKLTAEILAQEYGIGVRAGSFCTYALLRKLKGITPQQDRQIEREARQGITANIPSIVRASCSLYNRPSDLERFVDAIQDIAKQGYQAYNGRYEMDKRSGEWRVRG